MAASSEKTSDSKKHEPIDQIKMQERLIRLLHEFAYEKDKYHQRVASLLPADHNIWLPKSGSLKPMQLIDLLSEKDSGGFFVQPDFTDLLRRLDEWGIVVDFSALGEHGARLKLNEQAIRIYDGAGVLENCVWGPHFIFAKYAKATAAIIVEKESSEHIGTGSIVRFGSPENSKFFLLTNRHVVDPSESIVVKRIEIGNSEATLTSEWKLSTSDDLAAAMIAWEPTKPYFCLGYEARPLERVTTLGYPKIPFADDVYLAFHSGEVNTTFKTVNREEMFLISNQVGPGSSGGPVMNKKGFLIGVAAKAFQGKMEPDLDYFINWNAAVTFKRIRAFLGGVSGIEDWTTANWVDEYKPSATVPKTSS